MATKHKISILSDKITVCRLDKDNEIPPLPAPIGHGSRPFREPEVALPDFIHVLQATEAKFHERI